MVQHGVSWKRLRITITPIIRLTWQNTACGQYTHMIVLVETPTISGAEKDHFYKVKIRSRAFRIEFNNIR